MKKVSFDYYSLYLRSYLQDTEDPRCDNAEFIQGRADSAAEEFERMRREGHSVFAAQESAMSVLMEELSDFLVSPYENHVSSGKTMVIPE